MRYYPIFLDLRGRRCVVVGGGRVAERKVQALLRARAAVQVISPDLTPRLAELAAKKRIRVTPRRYQKGDLDRPLLVFTATNSPQTQKAVREDAEAAGALVNAADDRDHSSFLVPACFARGDLHVAISTSGASPALARRLRRQLKATLGREYESYLRFLREARRRILETVPNQEQRSRVFRRLAASFDTDRLGKPRRAENQARKLLRKFAIKARRRKN